VYEGRELNKLSYRAAEQMLTRIQYLSRLTSLLWSVCIICVPNSLRSYVSPQNKLFSKLKFTSIRSSNDFYSISELKRRLSQLDLRIESTLSGGVINYQQMKQKLRFLELESSQSAFWDDQSKAQEGLTEISKLKVNIERIEAWKSKVEDLFVYAELIEDGK
jgi:hypothetical protein